MIVRELINLIGFDIDEASMNKANGGVEKFKKNMKTAALAGAAFIGVIGWKAIEAASDMEMLATQFEVMLGSAEKASDIMDQLNQFAATTPFALEDLAKGTQNLLSFGVAEEDVIGTMRMLGDTAGGNKEKLDSLVLAYGKVQTKGKASLEEINMMAERGIPIFDILSKNMGVSREELFKLISAGKVSADDITKAFETMTSEGGMFFKGMEKQSLTFAGIVSTMKDNVKLLLATLGKELLPVAAQLVTMITTLLQGPLGDLMKALISGLAPALKAVSSLLGQVFSAVGPLSDILNVLFEVVGEVLKAIEFLGPILDPVMKALGLIGTVLKTLQPTLKILTSLLLEWADMMSKAFGEILMDLLNTITPVLMDIANLINQLVPIFVPIIRMWMILYTLMMKIKIFFKTMFFKTTMAVLHGILMGLKPLIDTLSKQLAPILLWLNKVMDKFGLSGDTLFSKLLSGFNKVLGIISKVVAGIVFLYSQLFYFKRNALDFLGVITKMISGFKTFISSVLMWIKLLFLSPGEAVKILWEKILEFVDKAIQWVFDKVGWAIDAVNALGFDLQKPEAPVTSGAAEANMGKTYGPTGGNTTNVSMENDITVTVPEGSAADPALIKETFKTASESVFNLELKKLLISSGY